MICHRHIFALYAAYILVAMVALGNCQVDTDGNSMLMSSEKTNGTEMQEENTNAPSMDESSDTVGQTDDMQIPSSPAGENDQSNSVETDLVPTFVSPVEKIMKTIISPIDWFGKITQGRNSQNTFGDVLNLIGSRFKAIYPGTEWCGSGNIASNSEELGLFKKTDNCCRTHDLCNSNIEAGESKDHLLNEGMFTRSHCDCDTNFYQCLKKARSLVATKIGFTYFTILRPQCFKEEYPARCIKRSATRPINKKCESYKLDKSQSKKWQWFDNPDF